MKFALDTNAYSALQLGNTPKLKALLDKAELLILPFIVDAELRAGFQGGQRKTDNTAKLKKFQSIDRVMVLWPDELTNEIYAQIWQELATKGKPIPTNDVWIAAICLQHQLPLATSDKHFNYVPLLKILSF
ncbi:MAG TPA: type II toxin-antitoxin system VapC family toxin [Candidatus Saccharimonadales bacterium]|nr:type II toxin-antitoxin system VapC family toxin [Candidatus Saccharimonadales bacterium]